ncbi:conserved hypothetical protein [Leishmania mexicana MHOM/GT/2001/U1103]|uniref:Seipin n=1 Tax=Leishmania mexicana (strain MHOM/GT/2001/U1103) TaxID=929439 RepID=E9B1G5_LEIMU|nr:conserved hypothetical protein [Leishmania mexicana MHOM/GT/2001/U1103]CBZ29071.1 conserved hypothetical protein [Leishmania mexicana MHOM/GT/2001/U1103]
MQKRSRRELSPPLPKAGMIGAAVECLHAVLHEVKLQQQELQAAITMHVKDSCAAGSMRMYTFLETSRYYLRYVLIFYTLLMAALVLLVADLSGCLVTSVATAAGIRHLVLANLPGTAVIPLHFNALPFHDDDWMRHLPEDTALRDFILPDRETRELIQSTTQRVDSLSLLHQHMGQFADAKFSLLNHFVNSHLASTTMHIPRTAASAEVFSPRGGVNLERLFQLGPAMFNAKGEYTAKMQVVLAKEEVGRDVLLILESAMLFSEDAMAVQSVAQFDVLFTKSTSVTVRTGPLHRSWLVLVLEKVLRFWFCLPVWSYEYLVGVLRQQDSAPFPPIDSSREVAVVLEVYHRFTPPLDLQPRLRAMNFTLYQLPDAGAPSRVKVSRLIFFSTVQLTGVARWLTAYPVSTFLLLVVILFAASAVASVGGLLGLLVYAYWRWHREQPLESFDEDDSDEEFFAPPRDVPATVVKSMPSPRLRRHRSSNDFHDTLDTSQLRRSQSFNYSPEKEEE